MTTTSAPCAPVPADAPGRCPRSSPPRCSCSPAACSALPTARRCAAWGWTPPTTTACRGRAAWPCCRAAGCRRGVRGHRCRTVALATALPRGARAVRWRPAGWAWWRRPSRSTSPWATRRPRVLGPVLARRRARGRFRRLGAGRRARDRGIATPGRPGARRAARRRGGARRHAGLVRVPRRLLRLGHRPRGTDPRERTGEPHRSRVGTSGLEPGRLAVRSYDEGSLGRSGHATYGRADLLLGGCPMRRLSLLLIMTILGALLCVPGPCDGRGQHRSTVDQPGLGARRAVDDGHRGPRLPGPGPTVVRLFSSDPSVAQVPVSITIPAGQTTGTFTITSNAAAPPTIVQIMGATPDNISRTHNLSVNAATPAGPSLSSVSFVPTSDRRRPERDRDRAVHRPDDPGRRRAAVEQPTRRSPGSRRRPSSAPTPRRARFNLATSTVTTATSVTITAQLVRGHQDGDDHRHSPERRRPRTS